MLTDLEVNGQTRPLDVPPATTPFGSVQPGFDSNADTPPDATPPQQEARAIAAGRAPYPADVRLPGMLRGHAVHPPHPGSRLRAVDVRAARRMPGVVAVIHEGDFAGVVALRDEQALAAALALNAQWIPAKPADRAPAHAVLRSDGGVDPAFAAAPLVFSACYRVPPIAHGPVCASAAVADVRPDGADLYVAARQQPGLRDRIADLLGLMPERVLIHPPMSGSTLDRGDAVGAELDAARLSQAVGKPVLVQWTLAEELALGPQQPLVDCAIEAAGDANGAIAGWRSRIRIHRHSGSDGLAVPDLLEAIPGGNAVPAYRVGAVDVRLELAPAAVASGAFRSAAAASNIFAIESCIDELASAASRDPLEFRLGLIDDPRMCRVLETVRLRSAWDTRPRAPGRGIGVACAVYQGTYVAQVAEVSVGRDDRIQLERVWCTVDAGRPVHPEAARYRIECGIQQAAGWALVERLQAHEGAVFSPNAQDHPIARCTDGPREIDVFFTGSSEHPPTGTGEAGSVPTAAAIANAVFDADGRRLRNLPLNRS
jgi:CO/xanthine dehydrogenase Mo-binding subunit